MAVTVIPNTSLLKCITQVAAGQAQEKPTGYGRSSTSSAERRPCTAGRAAGLRRLCTTGNVAPPELFAILATSESGGWHPRLQNVAPSGAGQAEPDEQGVRQTHNERAECGSGGLRTTSTGLEARRTRANPLPERERSFTRNKKPRSGNSAQAGFCEINPAIPTLALLALPSAPKA
jgi:hypothetical protein